MLSPIRLPHTSRLALAALLFILMLGLATGCGSDSDSVTGPGDTAPPTHYAITVQMSSIWAQENCENAPGNDGERKGIAMSPITFLVPNAPGSTFEVEHWIGEYDPEEDFSHHSWGIHVLDRREDQMWAAGARNYEDDRYTENEDGSGSGLYKFAVWNTRPECSGAAWYYVTWTPTTPVPES